MKLGIIGCGNIARFHISALKEVGFKLYSVAGSENSERAKKFGMENDIPNVFSNAEGLIKEGNWEALLITSSTETHIDYIKQAAKYGKPILVEKPVAYRSEDFDDILQFTNVLVAYNRRHYDSVEYAKAFVEKNPNALIKITIPESSAPISGNSEGINGLPLSVYENSTHIFDVLNYIVGEVSWQSASHIKSGGKILCLSGLGHGIHNINIMLDIYFDTPANFSIDIVTKSERVELRPIEIANHYCGIEVVEPSKETPIRLYLPQLIKQVMDGSRESKFKPGFLKQAEIFKLFCEGKGACASATLTDARNATLCVENLVDFITFVDEND